MIGRIYLRLCTRHVKQRHRPRHDLLDEAKRHFADGLPLALFPVLGADVIAENDTTDRQAGGNGEFEGVAFDLAGDGAENGEAGLLVVASVAENDGRATPRLFAACLRIEYQRVNDAQVRNRRCWGLMQGRSPFQRLRPTRSRDGGFQVSPD